MRFTIFTIVFSLFFFIASYAQYPSSPNEVGIIGAGLSYDDLTVVPNAGRVTLSSGVYEYMDWQNANLVVTGTDVVIRKCRLLWSGDGYFAIRCDNPSANLIIEDCEIDGQGNSSSNGIAFTGYSLIRSWLHNLGSDGLKANGAVTIYRSWIGPLNPLGDDPHCDVVQVLKNDGAPLIFSCSVFEGHLEPDNPYYDEWNGNTNVNCLRFSSEQGPAGDVVIVGNHFMGSGYQISFDPTNDCTYKVENNMFDTDFNHGYYYPTATPLNIIWDNNNNSDGGQVPLINTGEYTASYGTVPVISYPYYSTGNSAPVLTSIGDQTVTEGVQEIVSVSAIDNDASDNLSFSISGNPGFVTLTDNGDRTADLEISTSSVAGTYSNIIISVSDGTDSDLETISIIVEEDGPIIVLVTGVSVSPVDLQLEIGETSNLTETVEPGNATDQSVFWSSSNQGVATVDANGVVSALSSGQTAIIVTTNDGGFTAQCNVTVNPASSVPTNVALNKPVTVSDEHLPDDPKEELVDGDVLSYWAASGFPQWAEIDLQGSYDLTSIELITHQSRDYQYIVEASEDGVNYTTIVDRSANTEGINLVDAVSATASFVKITVYGANTYTGTWCSLKELIVMGVDAPVVRTESINADTDDQQINSDGSSSWVGQTLMRVGGSTSNVDGCAIFPFELPTLEAGESIVSATFNVSLERVANSPEGNVDVYALPYRSSSSALASDFWQGDYGTDPNSTAIQDDIATLSTSPGVLTIDAAGAQSLADYINAQYAAGAQAGDFIFIRLNPDYPDVRDFFYWSIYSANSANVPSLDLEIEGGSAPTIVHVTDISLSVASVFLNNGQTYMLTETIVPSNATDKTVSWSSDNASVATVDQSGLVTSVAAGSAVITVTSTDGGHTASCSIVVVEPVTGVDISQSALDLTIDETADLDETIIPANASDQSVSWSSSNNSVATVDANGLVTALSDGLTTITVTSNDGGFTADCQVTVTAPVWGQLTYDDFEDGWGNFKDGGGDCILYTGGSYAHQGNNAAQIQDNQGQYSTCPYNSSVDITAYTQLKIEFWFYGVDMDKNEDFFVEYSDDGGATWQIIASYVSEKDFYNNQFYSVLDGGDFPAVLIDNATYSFTNNAKIRFRCDANQNDDQVYIDEVSVTVLGSPAKAKEAKSIITNKMSDILIYPNPNPGNNVFIVLPSELEGARVAIYDMSGKQIIKKDVNGEQLVNINLSDNSMLRKGLYIIEVSTPLLNKVSKLIVR